MPVNNPSAQSAAALSGNHAQHFDETKKLSFWISQIFVLVATVLGVYLAAGQGFKQALAYGQVQSAQANYYLRKSLRNEIADNIPLVRQYLERVATGSPSARKEPLNIDTFVWDCLVNSPNTLETPPELLRESRRFYRDIADIHKKIGDNTFAVGEGKTRMEKALDAMEKDTLPKFDADLAKLKTAIRASGIEVE